MEDQQTDWTAREVRIGFVLAAAGQNRANYPNIVCSLWRIENGWLDLFNAAALDARRPLFVHPRMLIPAHPGVYWNIRDVDLDLVPGYPQVG